MMSGRNISASKLAMGSTRVMGNLRRGRSGRWNGSGDDGSKGCTPAELGRYHIQELRQTLLKDDCYLLGCRNTDSNDLARTAVVTASSHQKGYEAEKVINGVARDEERQQIAGVPAEFGRKAKNFA